MNTKNTLSTLETVSMVTQRRFFASIVGAVTAAFVCSSAHANLISNGSFETPAVPEGSYALYTTASTGITGWQVVGPQVAVVNGSLSQLGFTFNAQDGAQWLDLTGLEANSPQDGVEQTIVTTPGTMYDLSFWIGNMFDPSTSPINNYGMTSTVFLSIDGGSSIEYVNSLGDATTKGQNWEQFTTSFTADSTLTTITFRNGDLSTDNSCGLDSIVLTEANTPPSVPDAGSSLTLLGSALAMIGALRRKFRK